MKFEGESLKFEFGGGRKKSSARSTSEFKPQTSNFKLRKNAITALAITLALLAPEVASACAVCYGNPNSPMVKSADNATLFLLGTVGFVQICFIALFWTLWRRARALRRHREQFHVIHGGVR